MKKIIKLLTIFLLGFTVAYAQDVPAGMKYQAVARNSAGEILANRTLSLQIQLKGKPDGEATIHYSEEHTVTTNQLGLFDLVVGAGKTLTGVFNKIPWSSEDIWMGVSLKEKGTGFSAVSESRLLAVPYAFHAITASKLTGEKQTNTENAKEDNTSNAGVPAQVWSLKGNSNSDPLTDKLGTTDYQDLVLVTNNLERFRITKDGDISINNNLKVGRDVEVGNDLYVKKNVFLNTLEGSTINNGNFTVANTKETKLTGTLTVDGATFLKDSLKLIKNSENFVASFINTNTNKGDGIQIKLGKTHPGWSGSGYLNVTNVGAEIFQAQINTIRGWVINHNPFTPNDLYGLIPSSLIAGSTCNIVNLVIDKVNNSLHLPLNMPDVVMPDVVMPPVHLPALSVLIPDPIDERITITHGFDLNPPTVIFPRTAILPGFQMLPTIPHIPCGNLPTLSVPNIDFNNVSNSLTNDNQFVSFVDKDNRELGSVRAQSVNNWSANYLDGAYFVKLMAGIVGLDVPQGVAAAVAGFTDIAKSYNNIGVEYASGHADYAEWLERINPSEVISAGDIVGVKGGKVSKDLAGAEQILAVSHNPIVLGNMPAKEKEVYGNKIAFTGQVPVKVMGPVQVGDYIVARGDISGYGVAVNPANITTSDLKFTVGRSWEANLNEGPKMVNTLIGIDNGDYIKIMKDSQDKITAMEERMKLLEDKMEKILTVQGKKKNNSNRK